jgi:hypothetical protein
MTTERICKLYKDDYLEAKVTGKIPLSGRWEGQNTPTRLEKKKISWFYPEFNEIASLALELSYTE